MAETLAPAAATQEPATPTVTEAKPQKPAAVLENDTPVPAGAADAKKPAAKKSALPQPEEILAGKGKPKSAAKTVIDKILKAAAKPFKSMYESFMNTKGTGLAGLASRMVVRGIRLGGFAARKTKNLAQQQAQKRQEARPAEPAVRSRTPSIASAKPARQLPQRGGLTQRFAKAASPGQAPVAPAPAAKGPTVSQAAPKVQTAKLG